ncbi:MAG: CocE/NonD family hydrolase, partial [Bacteroidota bacterium]
MKQTYFPYCFLLLVCLFSFHLTFGQRLSKPFSFQFEGKTLHGLIETPQEQKVSAMVIIIPGYGRTNFVEGQWYSRLRDNLVAAGVSVCLWDKMGCGQSEGEFNPQQAVENSAEEALAAIREIKRLELPGAEKIGLWGLSRAGWICPLINVLHPVDFWISVSGTNDKENYGYLFASNLRIAGKSEAEVRRLHQTWMQWHRRYCEGASWEECREISQPLREDSTCQRLFGYKTEPPEDIEAAKSQHKLEQASFTSKGYLDEETGLWVYIPDFDSILLQFQCPVLAIFGENDSQVDWRQTKVLYEQSIGQQADPDLTIKTFPACNHSLQKCVSCAYREDLTALDWQACD